MTAVTAMTFVLCGLATWRVASLLHSEDAFGWLRRGIGIAHDDKGFPIIYPETFWGRLFGCFWCLSLAAAAPIVAVIAVMARLHIVWALLLWLATSTVAIWTEKQVMRSQSR